jgi:hypothetical protein
VYAAFLREPGLQSLLQSGSARNCWIECMDFKDFSGESACCAGSPVDVVETCLPTLLNRYVLFGLTELSCAQVAVSPRLSYLYSRARNASSAHLASEKTRIGARTAPQRS